MFIKKTFLLGAMFVALVFTLNSMSLVAQDRGDTQSLASDLRNAADEAWNAVRYERNSLDFNNPTVRQLYWSLRNFDRRAQRFAQETQEPWESSATLRNEALQLVNQASQINRIIDQGNIPDSVHSEWSEVQDSVANLADDYNIPYERERGLARRDYDDYGY